MWEAHKQRSDEAEDCSISPFCVHKKFPIGMFGQVRKDGKKSVVEKMKKRCGRNEMVKKNEVYNICPSRAEGGIAIFFWVGLMSWPCAVLKRVSEWDWQWGQGRWSSMKQIYPSIYIYIYTITQSLFLFLSSLQFLAFFVDTSCEEGVLAVSLACVRTVCLESYRLICMHTYMCLSLQTCTFPHTFFLS